MEKEGPVIINTPPVEIQEDHLIRKHYIEVLGLYSSSKHEVSCKDINKILVEREDLSKFFHRWIGYYFFDKVYINLKIGEDLAKIAEIVNISPIYFLPGNGTIYSLDEVRYQKDSKSQTLRAYMEANHSDECFLDNTEQRILMIYQEFGYRIIDESEITAVDLRALRLTAGMAAEPPTDQDVPEMDTDDSNDALTKPPPLDPRSIN